ncbi:MAG TPA: class IV adenylate cyclase [Candidatus Acidoferrum sp.]|nr:class IV adenylate cyclase [Candidatus Acidoferrum sp.]
MATNLEIEIKLRVENLPNLLRRLHQIGARDRGRVFQQNTIYDTPDADFHRHGRLVRLRTETAKNRRRKAKLTSKSPPDPTKTRSKRKEPAPRHKRTLERELEVRDPSRTARLLEAIGLSPSFRYEKYRTSFHLGRLHLDLDETPIGTFLELEGRPAAIDRVAKRLGYTPADYIRGTYWDLYAAYCRRQRQQPRNMVFSRKNGR